VKCQAALLEVCERPGYAFTENDVTALARAFSGLMSTADAGKLWAVQELRSRPTTVGGVTGRDVTRFLTEALRETPAQAERDLKAAAALGGPSAVLPVLGAAFAAGEVSREHVDVAVRTMGALPKVLKTKVIPEGRVDQDGVLQDATGAQVIDDVLTAQARVMQPVAVQRLCRELRQRLDPDRVDRFDADAAERSTCSMRTDFAGMTILHLITDPVNGLLIRAAIARRSKPRPAGTAVDETGATVVVPDRRTAGQRQAEAAVELLLVGAGLRPVPANADATDADRPGDTETDVSAPADADAADDHAAADHATVADDTAGDDTAAGQRDAGQEPVAEPVTQPAGMPGAAFRSQTYGADIDILIVATLEQVLAAYGPGGAAAARAGLATMTLAGNNGLYTGATLDPRVLGRLVCDSPLRRIITDQHGAPLHHGRSKRLAQPAQRRVLAVRDGGCVVPGCHAPPDWSDVHHLVPWEHGGRTDIDAMVLLCRHHHTAHHAGAYDIDIRDGLPWVRVPVWVDPTRPWLRNTSHRAIADAVARTLLDPPDAA